MSSSKSEKYFFETPIMDDEEEDIHQHYQKIISMYADYSRKIHTMLCECINKMTHNADLADRSSVLYSPRTLLPPELFRVIVREVSQLFES